MQDPFHAVRSEFAASLATTQRHLQEWNALVNAGQQNERYAKLLQELSSGTQALEMDLQDLAETINILFFPFTYSSCRLQPYKLDAKEIAARKEFVSMSERSIQEIRTALNNGQTKVAVAQRQALLKSPAGLSPGGQGANSRTAARQADNARFIEDESSRQQLVMRQQDEQLEGVLGTVTTLKNVALTMGQELDDQVGLLREVDDHVDNTQSKLKSAMARMNVILKSGNDTKSTCCIGILVVVLVVLLVFVII
ncbi:hypothetical protein RI367_004380 [Sorochytrium milnesiophthora]